MGVEDSSGQNVHGSDKLLSVKLLRDQKWNIMLLKSRLLNISSLSSSACSFSFKGTKVFVSGMLILVIV